METQSPTKAIVTVGLGFGDEGKGATVDYLCRVLRADLVVRYCGGAQAGHNVQLPDGHRHAFAQFGAGTFAGARTYLGPRMIISPATMVPEAEHLRNFGIARPFDLLSAHPDCLVSTVYHVGMNRLRELARGEHRHGSCGLGIGESRSHWLRHGQDAVMARDLKDRRALIAKLTLLRDRCLLEMQDLPHLDKEQCLLLHGTMPALEADLLLEAADQLKLADSLPDCRTMIFEGAQGVLLDEWKGFHPHTTWSTVTPYHALEMLSEHGVTDTTILGITRAFSTRHGAGPFPTYCPEITRQIIDPGNPANDWQGAIRCGPLDLVLLEYAARVCRLDGLVVNCLDRLPRHARVCTRYRGTSRLDVPHCLREQTALTETLQAAVPVLSETTSDALLELLSQLAPVVITATGPTYRDRHSPVRCDQLADKDVSLSTI